MCSNSMKEIESLYRKYGPMVIRRCFFLLKDEQEAYDATQDIFLKLMQQTQKTLTAPSSYLYTAATHTCLNRIRNRRKFAEDGHDLLDQIAHYEEDRSDARITLAWLFQSQRETTRLIAVMHLLEGYSLQETAERTGLSIAQVRTRIQKLRQNLKEKEAIS